MSEEAIVQGIMTQDIYTAVEMAKLLVRSGYVVKLTPEDVPMLRHDTVLVNGCLLEYWR